MSPVRSASECTSCVEEDGLEISVNGVALTTVMGDITEQRVDAIVNAANSQLLGGGGVDGAIHRAGGPEIMRECREIGSCPTGSAVWTKAGRLPSRFVIHAVAPRWGGGGQGESLLLKGAYRSSLELVEEIGALSVAFPSLGTGIYGYPIEEAAGIAITTVLDHILGPTKIHVVVFVLFSPSDLKVYDSVLTDQSDLSRSRRSIKGDPSL